MDHSTSDKGGRQKDIGGKAGGGVLDLVVACVRGGNRADALRWCADLAGVLGVSVKTVQGWRFRGQGPAWKKLAGSVRYPVDQFDVWVQAQPGGLGAAA